MRALILLGFSIFSTPLTAAEHTYDGNPIPIRVDMRDRFKNAEQQIGGTCHVASMVTLFKEACKRVAGVDVEPSFAYAMLQHFLAQSRNAPFDLTQDCSPGYILPKIKQGDKTYEADGGNPLDTATRLLSGNICPASEFPIDLKLLGSIQQTSLKYVGKTNAPSGSSDPFRNEIGSQIRTEMAKRLPPATFNVDGTVNYKTTDPNLSTCLSKGIVPWVFKIEKDNPNANPHRRKILALLSKGIPFACMGPTHLTPEKSGRIGGHAFIVAGYEYNPRGKPRDQMPYDFYQVDSNPGIASQGWELGCDSLVYFAVDPTPPLLTETQRKTQAKPKR